MGMYPIICWDFFKLFATRFTFVFTIPYFTNCEGVFQILCSKKWFAIRDIENSEKVTANLLLPKFSAVMHESNSFQKLLK